MSTETTRPLSLRHVDFDELYARHLGRHSQFGINVAHVLALYGLWFGIYAAVDQAARHLGAPMTWPILAAMAATYLALVDEMIASDKKLDRLPLDTAAAESMVLGRDVIRHINLDPVLPEALMPTRALTTLVRTMTAYDQHARQIWRRFMRAHAPRD